MKNLMSLPKLFLALAVIFFASSCATDDTINNPLVVGPTAFLESGPDVISSATTIDPGTPIAVRLSANAGDNDMNSLTIRENGDLVDPSRIMIDGVPENNPKLLFDDDVNSFVFDIEILAHAAGTSTYEFIVASSELGDEDVTSLDISITEGQLSLIVDNGAPGVSLDSPTLFAVPITAMQGASPLNTIQVLENGASILDLDRLRFGDASVSFDSNPFFLPLDDKAGFMKSILISTQTSGTSNYMIILEDEAGNSTSVAYEITINQPVTSLTGSFLGVPLFNNAGAAPGTINLDIGANESSVNNTTADIQDVGNDGSGVWRQVIQPINGAALRMLSVDSGFTYDGIDSRETLVSAWQGALDGDLDLSGTISVGATYMARVGAADYYVFICREVNNTGNASTQNYVFDIKQSQI